MTSNKVAWVHPNPLLAGFVVLPDGYQLDCAEANAKGFTVISWPDGEKLAEPHPHENDSVILARGVVVGRETADKAGFKIGERNAAADQSGPRGWRSAIMTSPEAKTRPAATAELLTTRTPETLTVEQARGFLRGLPVETEPTESTETMMTNEDPRAARLAEISNSMAAYNKSQGYAAKAQTAPQLSNIEPAKLKRLAEIEISSAAFNKSRGYAATKAQPALKLLTENRLSELAASGQARSQEAKSLRLALDTHNSVGTPLGRVLAQLGVDTSKLLPNV